MMVKVPTFWLHTLIALMAMALLGSAQCAAAHEAMMSAPTPSMVHLGHSMDHEHGHTPAALPDCCDSSALPCCVDLQISPALTLLKIDPSLLSLPFWPLLFSLPMTWVLWTRRLKPKEMPRPLTAQTPVSLKQVQLN
ncbi:MAG: hypothetical protein RRB13_06525 [bacterium]|nr:hypothetical protein [bacterium]